MKKVYLLLLIFSATVASCRKGNPAPDQTPPVITAPSSVKEGVTFMNGGKSAVVTLYAPDKKSVSLTGDFNSWNTTDKPMLYDAVRKTWSVQLDQLNPDQEYAYQFVIDGSLRIADPYAEKILDPDHDQYISSSVYPNLKPYPTGKTTGIVSVMQANAPAYVWKNTASFKRPEKNKLVIYELLIRDFTQGHSYASTLQKLDYLTNLGINAIELLPVNEFEGNLSWGYNPSFYFAPDKYYGTKSALQNFIDECHGRGIAVIIDMVFNHSFGQSPMVQMYFDQSAGKPAANSPWFNAEATHPFNVGYDFNHELPATTSFVKNVVKHWMETYKIDGIRFDLSKGFTQRKSAADDVFRAYDAGRVATWKAYNNHIKSIDANNFYVILEHFADVQEEKALAAEGMMLWNNLNYNMNEATMGWLGNSDFSWGLFNRHELPQAAGLVTYVQSHDEERTMFKNLQYGNGAGGYQVKELATALKREELAAAFLFGMPGPKMIWQFAELGYDVPIDFNGRTGEKPVRWAYVDDPGRKALQQAYAKMIRLKKSNAIFDSGNVQHDLAGAVKWLKLSDATNTVVIIGNFDVVNQVAAVDLGAAGLWYEVGAATPLNFTSSTYTATLAPGEYHIFSKSALSN